MASVTVTILFYVASMQPSVDTLIYFLDSLPDGATARELGID